MTHRDTFRLSSASPTPSGKFLIYGHKELHLFEEIKESRKSYVHGNRGYWRPGVAGSRKNNEKNPFLADRRAKKSK